MKIMIEIPNHLYELLKSYPFTSNESNIENILCKAVVDGIPFFNVNNAEEAKAYPIKERREKSDNG